MVNDNTAPATTPEPNDDDEVTIFQERPNATKDTFDQSVIYESGSDERLAVVLYAPDLQNIGSIDNTKSAASATYLRSVTEGFSVGSTITFSSTFSVEVSAEVFKASMQLGMSISFTAQYNKSTTESVSFTVPAGKKAFLYQGYLRTVILKHDVGRGTYAYVPNSDGRFLSNLTVTADKPVVGATTVRQG